jgi:hypothetical protein
MRLFRHHPTDLTPMETQNEGLVSVLMSVPMSVPMSQLIRSRQLRLAAVFASFATFENAACSATWAVAKWQAVLA